MGLGLGSLFGSYCGLGQPVHPDPWILHCHSPKELVVRLGFDLCAEEKAFLSRRKQVVAKALKQALQLDGDLQEDEVWGQSWTGWGSSGPVLDAGTGCALTRPELVPRQAWTLLYFPLTGLLSGAWSHQMQGTAKGTRH